MEKGGKKRIVSIGLSVALFIYFLYLIFLIPNAKSNPDAGVSNCTNLITAGETYLLENDIHNDQINSDCINIYSPNITLDCQGHYIFSIQNYSGVNSNATNVTIKNCNISMGSGRNTNAMGISLEKSNRSTVFNNYLFEQGNYGIYLSYSSNNTLINNTGISNSFMSSSNGIYIDQCLNNTLISNVGFSNSTYGISISSSNGSVLINNTGISNSSSLYGIYLRLSSRNTLTNNTGVSNLGYPGTYLSEASNNTLISNYGKIQLYSSKNNTLISNVLTVGAGPGIYIETSTGNILVNNTVRCNSSYAFSFSAGSSNNTLINNTGISYSSLGTYVFYSSHSSNTFISNTGISNSSYGFYFFHSSNNTLINNTGISNSSYGIYIGDYSSNNTLKGNIGLSNSSHGISMGIFSSNNTLINNTGISNSSYGIYIGVYSSNNTLINNTGMSTTPFGFGIVLQGSDNFLISNIGVSDSEGGIYIVSSFNNTLTNNTGISNSSYGIYLRLSHNNTLINNTGRSNSNHGIYLLSSSNNTLQSNNVAGSAYGFEIFGSQSYHYNNTIYSTNILDESYKFYYNYSISNYVYDLNSVPDAGAIFCAYCTNVTIKDLNLSHYNSDGIRFVGSNDSNIQNVTSMRNQYGAFFHNSFNNNISNSTFSNNKYGLYLYSSQEIVISNITAKNNSFHGLFFLQSSHYNILKDSFIQFNNYSAILLNNSMSIKPENNTFYNNYFNNSIQYSNISTSYVNHFNTTLTSGTNIVGGNYLAGNYWASPNGTGFSQTCTDRGDGICDAAYNFDNINYDYLPLVCHESWSCSDTWGECINNQQTKVCTDSNLCQTYHFKPVEETQSCGGAKVATSSSSGGEVTVYKSLEATSEVNSLEVLFDNSNISLVGINLNIKTEIENGSIILTTLNDNRTILQTGLPLGKLYQAFEILFANVSSAEIVNATLDFRINKTWLTENNISFHHKETSFWLVQNDIVGNIKLYRNPNGGNEWVPLTTEYLKEDNSYYYFSSYSLGFSTFAVFFSKYDCLPNSARCADNQVQLCLGNSTWLVTETCSDVCKSGKCQSLFFKSNEFYIVLGTVIGGIILIFVIIFVSKKIKNRKKFNKRRARENGRVRKKRR